VSDYCHIKSSTVMSSRLLSYRVIYCRTCSSCVGRPRECDTTQANLGHCAAQNAGPTELFEGERGRMTFLDLLVGHTSIGWASTSFTGGGTRARSASRTGASDSSRPVPKLFRTCSQVVPRGSKKPLNRPHPKTLGTTWEPNSPNTPQNDRSERTRKQDESITYG
jgi:hypothetical protein